MSEEAKKTIRIVIPEGRGRVGKTLMAQAIGEELRRRGERVELFDLDRSPGLSRRTTAREPNGISSAARRSLMESVIHEAFTGKFDWAVVDVGADDIIVNQLHYELPNMTEQLAKAGIVIIALHVLGPLEKDAAYFRKTYGKGAFGREIVVLNHGIMTDPELDPADEFASVRKLLNGVEPLEVGILPPKVVKAIEALSADKTLHDLARDIPTIEILGTMYLQGWLETSIAPIVDEILAPSSVVAV